MMLSHHGALDKLKLFHLEDGGFHHQRDYKSFLKCVISKSRKYINPPDNIMDGAKGISK